MEGKVKVGVQELFGKKPASKKVVFFKRRTGAITYVQCISDQQRFSKAITVLHRPQ